MLKVAVIGCGKIAQVRHIPEYAASPLAELAGFYNLSPERAEEMAAQYGGRTYASVEELLADPAIDAVSICTPNATHSEYAVAALKAGKHVLCEKPMAITLPDCEAMVAAAEESAKLLMIAQNQRFAKAHVEAKRLLSEGVIGDVLTYRTTFGHGGPETWSVTPGTGSWFFNAKSAALGAMGDLGVHKTDLIQFLLDQRVVEVSAKVTTLDKRDAEGNLVGVDDNAIAIYTMDGGTIGSMTASWTYYGAEDNSTVLYGTKGIMRIYDDPAHSIVVFAKDGTATNYDVDAIQTNDNQTSSGIIDAFVEAIEAGAESPVSGESAMSAMKAVLACVESSKIGRAIRID